MTREELMRVLEIIAEAQAECDDLIVVALLQQVINKILREFNGKA
jgi:hypothetical protein